MSKIRDEYERKKIKEDYEYLIKKYGIRDEILKCDCRSDEYFRYRVFIACALRDKGYSYKHVGEVLDRSRSVIYHYEKVNKIFQYYKKEQ
ncbi:hypothetical protein [uncultured Bacteroides sp.]|uniref:hypothetical protein n=1 Tax=uncultured Bacteroides sp. TaxID=162156 RepID=UPI00262E286D|nr:hypothetical protein [uncultured Bacteroides sp.]